MHKLTFFLFAYWHDPRYKGVVDASIKIFDLAVNLEKAGHTVLLFVPSCRAKDLGMKFKVIEIPILQLPVFRFLSYYIGSFLRALVASFKIKPDIIYFRRMMSILPVVLASLRGAGVILEINDDFMAAYRQSKPRSLKLFITKAIDRFNLKYSHGISIITDKLKSEVHQRYSIPLEKMKVIPSCSNTDVFKPLDAIHCRKELNLATDMIYIGFLGAMLPWKGVDTLVEAARIVLQQCMEVKFLLVGEGVIKTELMSRVEECGLKEKFVFTGQVPYSEAPKYINSMDICTAPYHSFSGEISPVKIFDYFACGKPVVSSDNVGDLILNSGGVISVPPADNEELARALISLVTDKDARDSLGNRGRAWVVENYDRRMVAHSILEMAHSIFGNEVG